MSKTLLVIDMLNDFILPKGRLYCGDGGAAIVSFVRAKIDEFLAEGEQVIFICDRHEANDLEFSRFPAHCIEDTPGAKVIEALRFDGWEGHVVGKQRYSGFFNTDLEEQLEDVAEVEVVGVCTNICVFFTVEELCNRDKQVTVWKDGVASFDQAAHAFALQQMASVLGAAVK